MADAYAHAQDTRHYSKEIALLHKVDRFGIEAILGRRILYYGEINAMITAENICLVYSSRAQSSNWAQWEKDNEDASKLLKEAMKCHSQAQA